ncbi:MAG: hypothetical protein NVSMB13_21040 [Mycobacteriales bacterium]
MVDKVPGSRRFRAAGDWPITRQYVGIDFVCDGPANQRRHPRTVVGRFRRDTYDGAETRVRMEPNPDGSLPEDVAGHGRAVLPCPVCGRDAIYRIERVQAALDALYAPGRRRVETRTV